MKTFTCPRCGAASVHPDDIREGYCGRCHDWTGNTGVAPSLRSLRDHFDHTDQSASIAEAEWDE